MGVSLNEFQENEPVNQGKKEGGESILQKVLKILSKDLGGNKLKDSQKESFFSELALLLEAGLNIKASLDLVLDQTKKEKHKKIFQSIIDNITLGMKFSDSLNVLSQFSDYEYYSVRIGEESGTLIKVLKGLAGFYNQKIKQKRTIIGALTYPAVILITALLAVTFMLVYMVPLFDDVFKRIGGDLPWLTQIILQVSEGFSSYFMTFLIIIGLLFGLHFRFRNKLKYKQIYFSILLRIPVLGDLIRESNILRLSQSLSLLMDSKVPLIEALKLSRKMINFHPVTFALESVERRIYQGKSLYEGMSEHPIFSKRMVSLIKVGEESNQLGMILSKFALQKEDELQHKAKMLGNVIEPLIIVFLGVFVAIILIAMYLPMFQLSTSMGF